MKILKAILKDEVCDRLHESHGVLKNTAYPVAEIITDKLYYNQKRARIITPGGRILIFAVDTECKLVEIEDEHTDAI
jgi:hypothetical protein